MAHSHPVMYSMRVLFGAELRKQYFKSSAVNDFLCGSTPLRASKFEYLRRKVVARTLLCTHESNIGCTYIYRPQVRDVRMTMCFIRFFLAQRCMQQAGFVRKSSTCQPVQPHVRGASTLKKNEYSRLCRISQLLSVFGASRASRHPSEHFMPRGLTPQHCCPQSVMAGFV